MSEEQDYKYNHILPISKYPFFDYGRVALQTSGLRIQDMDEDVIYDEIIKGALNDIIDSFQHNKITPEYEMDNNRIEVIKFHITLFILKSMPSLLMYKYWIKAYMNRFESITKNLTNMKLISIIFNELKMPHKFVRIDNLDMMMIKINDYLDFALQIKLNESRFLHLLLVNMPVHRGRVFVLCEDLNDFKLIIIKLVEKRIYELLDELELQVRSKKIDKAIEQLQGYMLKDPNHNKILKQLDYGEITPDIQVQNDKIIQMFKAKPREIDITQMPPCVNRLLNKLLKKEVLGHPENILLAAYLGSKGYTKEQMMDVFMTAGNADKKKIDYNLDYVLEKQLKPYNCSNCQTYNLCCKELDKTGKCERITNPMSF